uniref:Aminotransferase-like plant mobile domain-containing protein n=1 Tax=Fagus sylvatica TaxID=28930 RepID=A0A2N9IS89_FAGSY
MATTDVNTPASNPEVQTRIRHHCIVTKLMEVNKSLFDQCKRQLRTTPFGWLLNLHCNIEASGQMLEVMLGTWNADKRAFQLGSYAWGKAVYEYLVCGLNRAVASKKAHVNRGNLHIQGCTALLQIWACEHLGICEKHAKINQPFPRFLAWSHQRMFSQKAMAAFNNSDNVLCVLAAMPWEQQESVVQEAMETLKETHGSSHTTILRHDGAGPSNITHTASNQCQLQFQVERTERETLARHIRHLEDELNRVKGMLATVIESNPTVQQNQLPPSQNLEQKPATIQTQLPIPTEKTPIVDLPSSPSKAVKRGKPAKKKAKAAMVDLASSPSKRDKRGRLANNEGEATIAMVDLAISSSKRAMVDLVSSPSKVATFVRYTGGKARAQRNVMIVPLESEPVRNEPTAHDEAVLADLRKKWSFAIRQATRRRVDSNEVAISTKAYEIIGRDVSSLLGNQAQEESSRWISTTTTILASPGSTLTQRNKRPKKGKQPIEDDQSRPESIPQ